MELKQAGSPSGSGNPPGKFSKSYTASKTDGGHFNDTKGYGAMPVPVAGVKEVGNQVKQSKSSEPISNNPALR